MNDEEVRRGAGIAANEEIPVREFSDFPGPVSIPSGVPARIGGWLLILVGGLVISIVRMSLSFANDLLPAFEDDVWSVLTTPGTEAYHPNWAPVLTMELLGNAFFILFSLVLLVLLFMRKRFFPGLMILFLASNFLFVVGDFFYAETIPFVANQPHTDSVRELARSFISLIIWGPYFLVSTRVKRTFLD